MNVVLCVPPPNTVDHPLLGIASLAGLLRTKGHEVNICDINALLKLRHRLPARHHCKEGDAAWTDSTFLQAMQPTVNSLLDEFLKERSRIDIFGVHVPSASRPLAEIIGKHVRKYFPACRIIAGGPHFFTVPENPSSIASFDAVFIGEAEVSLSNWLDAGFPGGIFQATPIEMDDLPVPDFSGFPLDAYARQGVLPAETARGCVNRCAFCDDARMWKQYRTKTPARLMKDLEHLEKTGGTHVTFCDSVLNPTPRRFSAFLGVMKEAGLPWDGMIQAREVDEAVAGSMALSGCRDVFIGIESFSLPFLERLNKQAVSGDGARALQAVSSAGINVSMGLIVAGPPLQTRAEFEHDLINLAKLAPYLSSVAVNPLSIPSGTPLWKNAAAFGLHGLGGKQAWRFWHAGNGIDDIRLRLGWCREAINLLQSTGISTGANYDSFDQFVEDQLREAERYLR